MQSVTFGLYRRSLEFPLDISLRRRRAVGFGAHCFRAQSSERPCGRVSLPAPARAGQTLCRVAVESAPCASR
jgi:hypothetical protein